MHREQLGLSCEHRTLRVWQRSHDVLSLTGFIGSVFSGDVLSLRLSVGDCIGDDADESAGAGGQRAYSYDRGDCLKKNFAARSNLQVNFIERCVGRSRILIATGHYILYRCQVEILGLLVSPPACSLMLMSQMPSWIPT